MKAFLVACTTSLALTANAIPCNKSNLATFIVGNYTVIAQEPDSNKTYSGTLSIATTRNNLIRIVEKMPNKSLRIWQGQIRDASPGEGCVLEVKSKHLSMTCLVSTDLDNYARLTCLTKGISSRTKKPGLLALFPVK